MLQIATTTLAALNASSGLTDVTTTDAPPGATGVLRGTVNGAPTFRIAPTTGTTAPFGTGNNDYWIRFWVRFRDVVPPMPADYTLNFAQMMNLAAVIFHVSTVGNGFWPEVRQYVSGTNGPNADGMYAYTIQPNQWVEMTMRVRNTASGIVEWYINRKRISSASGNLATTGTNWNVGLPALAAGYWELGRNCEAWSGTDIDLTPLVSMEPADSTVGTAAIACNVGIDYTATTLSGAPTVSTAPVATAGLNPVSTYIRVSGSAGASTRIDFNPIGNLKTRDRWGVLHLPSVYLPSGASAVLAVRNAADTADLLSLRIEGGSVIETGVAAAPFPSATRNALSVFLGSSGDSRLLVNDLTTYPINSDQATWGKKLKGWTPQPLGKVSLTVTLGSASCDIVPLWSGSVLSLYGMDSQSSATANASNPAYTVPNNISAGFAFTSDAIAVPGQTSNLALCPDYRRRIGCCIGRSGMKMSEWVASFLPALQQVAGVELIMLEGGALNDTTLATDAATAYTVAVAIDGYDAQLEAWATASPGRRLKTSSIIERSLSTHWVGSPATAIVQARLQCIRFVNAFRRARFANHANPAIVFCDTAATLSASEQAAAIELTSPPHLKSIAGNARVAAAFHAIEEIGDRPPINTVVAGPGASLNTIRVLVGNLPVADADAWVTSDAAGNVVVAGTLQTDSLGQVRFLLDKGITFYFWAQKNGINAIQGQAFTAE